MRIYFVSVVAAFLLIVALVVAQSPDDKGGETGGGKAGDKAGGKGKGGKGGGGPAGKNLQVLTGNIPETMQSFVQALGLLDQGACAYCHVEDKSSDQKIQKVTARRMVIMLRAINGTFPDGKQHVTCFTCHRGSTTPPMAP